MAKKTTKNKQSIRVELEGETLENFNQIKKEVNLTQNTEVVRYCINEMANQSNFAITSDQMTDIQNLLSNRYLQKKFHVYNTHELVKKAIDTYVSNMLANIEPLSSYDVRTSLSVEENKIANCFLKCQKASGDKFISVSQLAKFGNYKNKVKLRDTLESFVERGFLQILDQEGERLYYSK